MLAERSGLGRHSDRSTRHPRLLFEAITSAEPPDLLDVASDDSMLSRIDRRFLKLEIPLSLVSGIAVFALMLLAAVSVGGRNGFNQPLPGYVDWIEQAMPLIDFMGISHVQREGAQVRMDVLAGMLRGRALYAVEFVFVLALLAFMALMVWRGWAHFERSFALPRPCGAATVPWMSAGNFDDSGPVGDGVSELRIDCGPGYRVQCLRRRELRVVFPWDGNKSSRDRDTRKAKALASEWKD